MSAPTEERVFTADAGTYVDPDQTKPEDLAHYVDQRHGQDVAAAMIEGIEVEALCGYRWVPWRDPRNLPTCPACVEALHAIVRQP